MPEVDRHVRALRTRDVNLAPAHPRQGNLLLAHPRFDENAIAPADPATLRTPLQTSVHEQIQHLEAEERRTLAQLKQKEDEIRRTDAKLRQRKEEIRHQTDVRAKESKELDREFNLLVQDRTLLEEKLSHYHRKATKIVNNRGSRSVLINLKDRMNKTISNLTATNDKLYPFLELDSAETGRRLMAEKELVTEEVIDVVDSYLEERDGDPPSILGDDLDSLSSISTHWPTNQQHSTAKHGSNRQQREEGLPQIDEENPHPSSKDRDAMNSYLDQWEDIDNALQQTMQGLRDLDLDLDRSRRPILTKKNMVFNKTTKNKSSSKKEKSEQEPVKKQKSQPEFDLEETDQPDNHKFFAGFAKPSLSTFDGTKSQYKDWKAEFDTFVHKRRAPVRSKMLMLKRSLTGNPKRLVKNLGYTLSEYRLALEKLDTKYGGERRYVQTQLQEILNIVPMSTDGNLKALESFADKIEETISKLESDHTEELEGISTLYIAVMSKMPSTWMVDYKIWLSSQSDDVEDGIQTFSAWLSWQVIIRTEAKELTMGNDNSKPNNSNKRQAHSNATTQPEPVQPPSQQTRTAAPSVTSNVHSSTPPPQKDESQKPTEPKPKVCPICQQQHDFSDCPKYDKMSIQERWSTAKKLRMCFICLRGTHRAALCKKKKKCGTNDCNRTHHPSLHSEQPENDIEPKAADKKTAKEATKNTHRLSSQGGEYSMNIVALRTIPIYLCDPNGSKVLVNAFLDEGSDTSYVREDLVDALGCDRTKSQLTVSSLVEDSVIDSSIVTIDIESLDGKVKRPLSVRTVQTMCRNLEIVNWSVKKNQWDHLKGIEFHKLPGRKTVDLMIGADYIDLITAVEPEVHGLVGEPIARKTPLGWTCVGRLVQSVSNTNHTQTHSTVSTHTDAQDVQVELLLKKHWEHDLQCTENANQSNSVWSPDEKLAVEKAKATRRYINGRYGVGVSWRRKRPRLPNNFSSTKKRLLNLEATLRKDPMKAKAYCEGFISNVEKGYLEKKDRSVLKEIDAHFMAHFPIWKFLRLTTKLRIVYDSAAKFQGVCLNDEMLTGPKLLTDLLRVFIAFRKELIALMADICEMFSQVLMALEDRRYHRILWRNLEDKEIEVYESTRLPFGDRASPFLAQFIVTEHAKENSEEFPMASKAVAENMYVDDVLASVATDEQAIQLRTEMTELLQRAGFKIRKWCSNKVSVLAGIPEEDLHTGVNIKESELPSTSTLGVKWDAQNDVFTFTVKETELVKTKRGTLSHMVKQFDPAQFLAPFTIRIRMLLQEMWIAGLGWDDNLPERLDKDLENWDAELRQVESVTIPRCIRPSCPVKSRELHTFCDASTKAYACVCYTRVVAENGEVKVSIIAAKARVTPLKTVSVPRLELMAALLGLRLSINVASALGIEQSAITYWSDSTDVIHWIRGQSRQYKPFVANRVSQIHEESTPSQWKYICTEDNIADLATRGATVHQMKTGAWFTGPYFLSELEIDPSLGKMPTDTISEIARREITKSAVSSATVTEPIPEPFKIDRYSTLNRARRVAGWIARLIKFIHTKQKPSGNLTAAEIAEGEKFLVRLVQRREFASTFKCIEKGKTLPKSDRTHQLAPFIDSDGILRVKGRLERSSLPYESKHPVILPKSHHFTTLVVSHYHRRTYHVRGVNGLHADIRQKYWIMRGREVIKIYESDCLICQMRRKKRACQEMSPLPMTRLEEKMQCFANCGVDFAGPFEVKITRRVSAKRYLCLFTCLVTRAVHLEVSYSMNTSAFLNALSRMVARRGKPDYVVSDNGSNLVAGEKELRQLVESLDQSAIIDSAANRGIEWEFNPPYGSHHGGVFESLIKSSKRALYAILGNVKLTDEELQTAVVEVEGLLNSRPLTYTSSDPKDALPLTPNHFLMGSAGDMLAPRVPIEIFRNLSQRWKYIQDLVRDIWYRFKKEYLTTLQARKKWTERKPNLEVGDIAILLDQHVAVGEWPLAKVLETMPGEDGLVRKVKVLCRGKEYTRPITQLAPLELYRDKESDGRSLVTGGSVDTKPRIRTRSSKKC